MFCLMLYCLMLSLSATKQRLHAFVYMVAVRQVWQKLMQEIGRLQRDGELSSDEQHWLAASVQQATDLHCAQIDDIVTSKVEELGKP